MKDELQMVDFSYPEAPYNVKLENLTPVSFSFAVKFNKRYIRAFRYEFKIGKQPKTTPNWKLKQILKKIYG